MSVAFLVTSLLVVVTPGVGVLYTMSAGLSRGVRASVVAAVGCTLGIVPHMVAAITGLAALLNASATAFQTLKYFGVAYLLWIAWNTRTERGGLQLDSSAPPRSAGQVIARGILVNTLNPKLTIFFFAFLPQFVPAGEPHAASRMVGLSAVFMLQTLVVFIGYGAFAARIRTHVVSRPQVLTWLRRTFAAGFLALAARLALADR